MPSPGRKQEREWGIQTIVGKSFQENQNHGKHQLKTFRRLETHGNSSNVQNVLTWYPTQASGGAQNHFDSQNIMKSTILRLTWTKNAPKNRSIVELVITAHDAPRHVINFKMGHSMDMQLVGKNRQMHVKLHFFCPSPLLWMCWRNRYFFFQFFLGNPVFGCSSRVQMYKTLVFDKGGMGTSYFDNSVT